MAEHRVASHLGVRAADYDQAIRRWIPGYEEMIANVVAVLDEALPAEPQVVDLGAGTGALSEAILAAIPRARVRLVDIDPTMLDAAKVRLARFGDRAEVACTSFDRAFAGASRTCDAVVACLALHHVAARDAKQALYATIHGALRAGGVLLSADATVHEDGAEHDLMYRAWAARMGDHGIGPGAADALFAQWSLEDRYDPLTAELAMLAAAGFARPDCFWKRGAMTVFGGFAS